MYRNGQVSIHQEKCAIESLIESRISKNPIKCYFGKGCVWIRNMDIKKHQESFEIHLEKIRLHMVKNKIRISFLSERQTRS